MLRINEQAVKKTGFQRRRLLQALAAGGITAPFGLRLIAQSKTQLTVPMLRDAEAVLGENLTDERLQIVQIALKRNLDQFQIVRDFEVDDLIEPAPMFITKRYAGEAGNSAVVNHQDAREGSHGK
jgi:hypothetical protein